MKSKSEEDLKVFKKQKNFTNRLAKRERAKYFANLDLNKYTDNLKFWYTVKPMFSNGGAGHNKITLVENGEVITDDKLNSENFNEFFIDAVSSLAIHLSRICVFRMKTLRLYDQNARNTSNHIEKSKQKYQNCNSSENSNIS